MDTDLVRTEGLRRFDGHSGQGVSVRGSAAGCGKEREEEDVNLG